MKKNDTQQTLVLLDAHAILHRAYHALPDFTSTTGEATGALYGTVTMLIKIMEEFSPEAIAACYDLPEATYRHDAYEKYKSTRQKTDESLVEQIDRSRDIFHAFGIPIYECAGFEADDVLGTIAHQMKSQPDVRVVIASGDMDTMQCIDGERVQVYTLKKGIKDTVLYDEAAVVERFGFGSDLIPDYKGLRGDASDNIPGIAGIGEKTATTLITGWGSLESIYETVQTDEAALLAGGIKPRIINLLRDGEEEAFFSKMLATIRTDVPISFSFPERSWYESVDTEAIDTLFSELSFRSLGARVEQLLARWNGGVAETDEPEAKAEPAAPTEEVEQTAIALWLLESDTTNPTYEDIMSYGRAHGLGSDFPTIQAAIFAAVDAHGLTELFQTVELPLRQVIAHMESVGILLDQKQFTTLSEDMHRELEQVAKEVYGLAEAEFNLNSPKQLAEVLYDQLGLTPKNAKKTAGGQRTTRESELEKMRDDHPIIEHILRYRELQKLVSTYVDPLPKLVGEDGRLRPTFLQAGTTTGRMACKDPNLQNIPTRTEESKAIRRGFIAAPGTTLVSIDYSQIELRIAAILSQDANLIDIFTRGEDVHTGVAVRVFGVHADEVTSEMRRQAKVINFGILYGMGVNALRTNLGPETTRAAAQEFLNAYFQTFTGLAEYLEAVKEETRRVGYTTTLFGRRRYFPAIGSSVPHLRAQAERMAINAPVQGTAADVMRIAMNQVYQYRQEAGAQNTLQILLQVHDEMVFELADTELGTHIPELVTRMESVLAGQETHGVPITVDVATGANWADLTEWSDT